MKHIHVDFNVQKIESGRFVKVNSSPAPRKHLAPNFDVNVATSHSVNESSLLLLYPNERLKLDENFSIILNST